MRNSWQAPVQERRSSSALTVSSHSACRLGRVRRIFPGDRWVRNRGIVGRRRAHRPDSWSALAVFALIGTVLLAGPVPGSPVASGVAVTTSGATCGPLPASGPAPPSSGGFHPVRPTRLLDSRLTTGPTEPGCALQIDLSSSVPTSAEAVAVDVVAVDPSSTGHVTAYPCSSPPPLASNLNLRVGAPAANGAVVALDGSRRLCLLASTSTDLVVDLMGWFGPAGATFHGTDPTRVMDSRTGPRPDGGSGPLAANRITRLPLAGTATVPAGAVAVAANFTVTGPRGAGHLTVFGCDGSTPLTSSLNFTAGETRANQVLVGLDASGGLCVSTNVVADLVVDLSGWFGGDDGQRHYPTGAERVVDSRSGVGVSGALGEGEVRSFDPTRLGAVPVGSGAVLDVVATGASSAGHLLVYPCGTPPPLASTVNFRPGEDIANNVSLSFGVDGLVCMAASSRVHVVIDVLGGFGPAGSLRALDIDGKSLLPTFQPDDHDYGVVCSAGVDQWVVRAVGVPGATVSVAGGASSATLEVRADQSVDVAVTLASGRVDHYLVRCLPPDFPSYTVKRPDSPTPGWYLATIGPYAVIFDDHGAPVWYRRNAGPVADFKLSPSGNLSWWVVTNGPGGGDGRVQESRLDGTVVHNWRASPGNFTDVHDAFYLPNGNVMVAINHLRSGADISALGPGFTSPSRVLDAWLQEIRPDGSVAWEWHSEDHVSVGETTAHLDGTPITFVGAVDLLHVNSFEVDEATGNVIASFRHSDSVLSIRRDPGRPGDGRVLWKLGGNAPTDPATRHFTVVDDPLGGPHRQHDARLLPGGRIGIFDNATDRTSVPSRAVEYQLDTQAWTASLVWQQSHPRGTQAEGAGSARAQGDGSRVISWGFTAPSFSDYGPGGTLTLEVDPGVANSSYRVIKVPESSFDPDQLRATSGWTT